MLFDCDGVLLDSEPLSEWAWRAALAEVGVELEDFSVWVGKTDQELALHFAAAADMSPSRLTSLMGEFLMQRLDEEGVEVFADAAVALDVAERSRLGMAVVSNSESWRLDAILSAGSIKDRFSVVVSSTDVSRPKPHPDMYLLAAQQLGAPPIRCLVIEDSPTGITAARAAGMRVVAVDRGVFPIDDLTHATKIVPSMDHGLG